MSKRDLSYRHGEEAQPTWPSRISGLLRSARNDDLAGCERSLIIATFFGVGFFKYAPGTLGSLASLLIWAPCVFFEISPWIRLGLVLAVFLLGWWATWRAVPQFKSTDPQEIVIDEVAGQGLALVFCPASWVALGAGFILFRLFDIFKPWPISFIDRKVKSALGVMLDDMLAGVFAAVILILI